MNVFFRFGIILFLFASSIAAMGQQSELTGRVIDADTKEPIPFANIALKEIYKGTACNIHGEFSFKVDSLPVALVISHLSYEPQEIEVKDNQYLTIELTAGKLVLDELVISAMGNDEYAYQLVENAYYKILSSMNKQNFGKAFYRQISKNGDEYSELYEIFYDTKYSSNGIEDWAIQEGRYALKLSTVDSFIYNKNFTLMVRLLSIIQPQTDDLIMPISRDVREEYYLLTDRIISVNNRKLAQIRFEVKEDINEPAMEGEMLIDTDSFEVLKISGKIVHDNLKFISLKSKSGSWKNYEVTFEFAFKTLDNGQLAPDYMQLGQSFDFYIDDVLINKVQTKSFFSYYEYYDPPDKKKLGGRLLRYSKRDSELLDNIGYNQLFWDENIIVKRTPIESEVIKSFEKERAFGSIYLNNKSQIEIEDYTVDKDPYIVKVKQILRDSKVANKIEKIYLHCDKPFYASGETILVKAYVVSADNILIPRESAELRIDLFAPDGKLALSKNFVLKEGRAQGGIIIPNELQSGMYILKAQTDRNNELSGLLSYKEDLAIINLTDERDLIALAQKDSVKRFFFNPEGNVIIDGLPNQLGFVSTDLFNNTLAVKGKITDENGQTAGSVKSQYEGFGSVFIMPRSDVQFQARINSDSVNIPEFPVISKSGYAVMVNNLRPNAIDITVNGTMKLEGKKFYILMISNGVLYDRRVGLLTRGLFKTEIPKANLPRGVSQMLLVDDMGIIRCRRLVFCDQPDEAFVKYYLAKKDFDARERIDLVLEIKDENGKALNGANVSVSVLDEDKVSRNPVSRSIRSYLDLGYLVDYKIESPGELFVNTNRETLKNLDFIMLNQHSVFPEFSVSDSLKYVVESESEADSYGHRSEFGQRVIKVVDMEMPNDMKRYAQQLRKDRLAGYPLIESKNISDEEIEFESPDYSNKSGSYPNPDLRTTIYWNPTVITNKKGRAKISFYNSDTAKNFQITVEGISPDGLPIFNVYSFGKNAGRKR